MIRNVSLPPRFVKSIDFERVLRAHLRIDAARDDAAAALLHEIQVVVVPRSAERIVPREEDDDLAARRQGDRIVRLAAEAEDVRRVPGSLKEMRMAGIGDARNRRDVRAGVDVAPEIVPGGVVADRRHVRANAVGGIVQRAGRVRRHRTRAVVREPEEPQIVDDDVVGRGEEVDGLIEREVGVAVGERELRARRDVVHDLEQRRPFCAGAGKPARRTRRRQALEIAIGLKRLSRDAARRRRERPGRRPRARRVRQIAERDRTIRCAAARRAAGRKQPFQSVRDHADAHAGAVDAELLARDVRGHDAVAFARDRSDPSHGVVRQLDERHRRQRGDGRQPRCRDSRLHAALGRVGDFDDRAGRRQLLNRVVGDGGHEHRHLHAARRVHAQTTSAHRVLRRHRQGVEGQRASLAGRHRCDLGPHGRGQREVREHGAQPRRHDLPAHRVLVKGNEDDRQNRACGQARNRRTKVTNAHESAPTDRRALASHYQSARPTWPRPEPAPRPGRAGSRC